MHGVGFDAFGEVFADGAVFGVRRVRGAHDFTVAGDGVLAFQNLNNNRAGAHELAQFAKERALTVNGVEASRLIHGQVKALLGDDPQTGFLKTRVDLTGQIAASCVRFDDREGLFDSHVCSPGGLRPIEIAAEHLSRPVRGGVIAPRPLCCNREMGLFAWRLSGLAKGDVSGIKRRMLHVNDLTYRIGGRTLFEKATAVVPAGHKAGLVGRNGTGKTTLFRLILGELQQDDGSVNVHPRASVGTVAQEAPAGDITLIDTVLAADRERAALLDEAEHATDPDRIGEIHTRLADINAHTAPARAASILAGLGFDDAAQKRSVSEFSGGWRMRVALAAALFRAPDLLLLDEPTNHLDLEAAMWLEHHLKTWRGTLLLISHERTFLNAVCDEIIHVEARKLNRYVGNYDRFERTRREAQERDAKMRTKQLAQRRHIESFINRFRAKASKATQAQSRIKMLERMEPIASVVEARTVSFDFPTPDPLSPPLVVLDDASVGYEAEKPILKKLDLRIDMDDRIGLLGANGNGKSTLVKLISDRLKPMNGRLQKSSKLQVGYFAQHQLEELNPGGTPVSHLQALQPMEPERRIRAQLGRFGFEIEKADTNVEKLSGGEKARLLFSLMSRDAPHILVLDEPTNHLDVDAREALIHALNGYDGAVILVSHDVHLIGAVCDRLWLVADGTVREYDRDVEEYRRSLLDLPARREPGSKRAAAKEPVNPKDDRKARAEARAETANLRKAIARVERELEKLNTAFDEVKQELARPDIYEPESKRELIELQTRYSEVERDIERAEEVWLKASGALEAAES